MTPAVEKESNNGIWKTFLVRTLLVLLSVLGFIFLSYATWNYTELSCIRSEVKLKLDKEQYYRDIDNINKKLDGIDRKLDGVFDRIGH